MTVIQLIGLMLVVSLCAALPLMIWRRRRVERRPPDADIEVF